MYLNDVAYNLQQCIEKTLKAFLECKGVTVSQTHSIHKLTAMSKNSGSAAIITDWIEANQYEIETWASDTRYNFDMNLEFERIQCGLQEVEHFLVKNHMSYTLNPELDEDMKAKLRTKLPQTLVIHDD